MLRDLLGASTSTPGRRLLPATAPAVRVGGGGEEAQYSANDGMWEAGAVGVDLTRDGRPGQLAAAVPTAGPADDADAAQDGTSSDEEPAAVSDSSPVAQRPRESSSLMVAARQLGVPDLQEMRPRGSSSLCVTARQAGNLLQLATARTALLNSDGRQAGEGQAAAHRGSAAGAAGAGTGASAVPAGAVLAPAAPAADSGAPLTAKRRGRRVHPACLCPAVANE